MYTIKSDRKLSDAEIVQAINSLKITHTTSRRKHPEYGIEYSFVEITLPSVW